MEIQKQSLKGILVKRYTANMQQIYMKTPMQKYDFYEVALQLY